MPAFFAAKFKGMVFCCVFIIKFNLYNMENDYQKIIVPILGMHCKSCELLIEDELKNIKGVKKVSANFNRSQVEIFYDDHRPNNGQITEAIERAGYKIGQDVESSALISKDKKIYKDLGIAFLFLVGIYFLLREFGLTNLNFISSKDNLTVPLVFLIGLTAGVSTCMALVGGLVLGISSKHNEAHPTATAMEKFRPHVFFNLGRFLSYAFLGGILGVLGQAFQLSGLTLGLLTIGVGLVMLIMGLQLIEIFPWISRVKFTLPKSISRILGINSQTKEYSHKNSMVMGALTFFLPCGFTQAMQIYAVSTGSFWGGMLVMGTFALGTMPGLLSVGGLTSIVKGAFAKRFFKFAGLVVIGFALLNISNGFGLTGFTLAAGNDNPASINDPNVTLVNGVQVVKMTEDSRGYSPNKFTIRKGIPVKWVIDAQEPYSCASTILISQLNIRQQLTAGENIIQFTPTQTGSLRFSCSMGMYTGVFNVVDANGSSNTVSAANSIPSTGSSPSAGGSCGAGGGGCGCGGGAARNITQTQGAVQNTTDNNSGNSSVQLINATYTASDYLQPNTFKVKAGQPVKIAIDVKDNGSGCGYAITIPGLYNNVEPLQAGQPILMEFTPQTPGNYDITCGMGMIRFGSIEVD